MAEKRLSIGLFLNDKQFQSGLRKSANSLTKFGKKMQRTGTELSQKFTLPLLAAGAGAVKLASDFEESLNKTRVAFGQSSEQVEAFAQTTLKSFGIAEGSALEMASLFGDMATSMGLSQEEAAAMSTSLTGLAGDLASFKNIGIEQAQTALAGIFTGETESLKKLGIVITESNLKQFGYNKTMSETEKIAIRYKAIMEQTKNAQGDYIRTSDGLANSTRTLSETTKELAVEFGQILMPFASKLVGILQRLSEKIKGLTDEQKESIVKWAAILAVVGPGVILFGKLAAAVGSIMKAVRLLNAAVVANPLVVLALAAAAFVTAIGFAILDTEAFIKTALKFGKVGRIVAKSMLNFASSIGLMSKPEALASIATIDGMAKSEEELAKDLTDSTDKIKEQEKELNKLKLSLKDVNKLLEEGNKRRKPKFREIDRIEPKQATSVDNTLETTPLTAVLPEELKGAELPPMLQPSYYDELASKVSNLGNILMNVWGGAFDVMNSFYERQLENIDREKEEALLKLEREHAYTILLEQEEAKRFNAMSREEKKKFKLREDLEKKQLAIEEEMAKKKKRIARKQAKMQKAAALFSAFVNTASAVVEALPNVPLSIAVGIAGAAQIAAIASQPLPELADGGIAFGDTIARVGEYQGASVNPEVIAPLNKLESMLGMKTVNVVGTISGEDIVLASERFGERANRLD